MRVAINAVALILTTAICSAAQGQNVYYVDDDALPGGDGLSWGTAFNYLQDALATSLPGDTIKIAEGNYRPDLGNGQSFGDNESSFLVPGGVSLLGGYAGALGMDPTA